jgi:hypothetical protein
LSFAMESNNKLNNYNDYYHLATIAYIRNSAIKKVAYPNGYGALNDDIPNEVDVEHWVSVVHMIYDAVQSGDMSYENALDYYSSQLKDVDDEPNKFKNWIKYYKNGEHLKYNVTASRREQMKKKSDFQFPLSGSGFYPMDSKPMPEKSIAPINNKEDFNDWKNKLYVAIRRLDKLLRQGDSHMNSDIHADLADLLHAFDMEVRRVKMASTASDLTKRAALAFEKRGFGEHAKELYSLAQQTPMPPEINAAPDDVLGDQIEEQDTPLTNTDKQTNSEIIPETPIGDILTSSPGARPGEYEALDGDITLSIASDKLEEIAGMLADRRVVRMLNEFDIMLDKLGVAPMFPELAEAQSKLIDSYSYAMTRVTKMLGMLASGKSLSEISHAKEKEMQRSIEKDNSKLFNPEEEDVSKGTEAISEEFDSTEPAVAKPAAKAPVQNPVTQAEPSGPIDQDRVEG